MKILVTGGAGFIGSHIVDKYIENGHDVVVIDNLSKGKMENLNRRATFYRCDITDKEKIIRIFKKEKPDIVSHHAAHNNFPESFRNPIRDLEINVVGTINIINAMKEVGSKKIIYASSGGLTYGDEVKLPINENHPINPLGPYAISKLAAEFYISVFAKRYEFKYTILRYANVYGPRQDINGDVGIVAILIGKLLRNEQISIRGSGKQTRDFIYVKDVANANLAALERGDNEIFNIGSGKETSINELFEIIKKVIGKPNAKLQHKPAIEGDERRFVFDITKAKKILKWKPEYSLKDGIKETVKYWVKKL